ncbi:MAG: citrate lyase holo-[acyl-carrier protein] synthase [Candidatus Izemoplasmataceae bacterium]
MNPVLKARELRANMIDEWSVNHRNSAILVLKLNVVGDEKNIKRMQFILAFFHHQIIKLFSHHIGHYQFVSSLDGDYYIYAIDEKGRLIKERTIVLEDHNMIGRLVDMDVYDHGAISRTDLSCDLRTCLVCEEYAHICARSKRHSKTEIFDKVNQIIDEFLVNHISTETIKAIYQELDLFPKFGLVSSHDSGCHTDMTYETFIKSIFALKPFIKEYIEVGLTNEFRPFVLQEIGQRAENKMFEATGGTNTHKGLIFLLGVFLSALVKTVLEHEGKAYLQQSIQEITKDIVGDYYEHVEEKQEKTNGDIIYLNYGLKGIRGEALKGLPLIFQIPSFEEIYGVCRLHEYLIRLMAELDDTTIVHKTNYQTLIEVQKDMKSIIRSGGYCLNKETVHRLSKEYKTRMISPGGSADLLVIKIIYEELKVFLRD